MNEGGYTRTAVESNSSKRATSGRVRTGANDPTRPFKEEVIDFNSLVFAAVEGEALLVGIGTFAIGVAGFSAVAASLRQDTPAWTPVHSLRVRAIVSTSFNVAFESVVPLIAVSALGEPHEAVLVASLITGTYALAVVVLRGRQIWLTGAIRTRSVQVMAALGRFP